MEAIPLRIGGDKQQREIGWLFFVYCPANFALRSVQKTLGAIQQKISILPDYDFKDGRGKGTSFAGVAGAGITCLLIGAAGWGISRAKRTKNTGKEKARK